MTRRIVVSVLLVALVAAPVYAQDRGTESMAWQSMAAALQPGTFVEVRLKDGTHFKGTFVQRLDHGVIVKPRTRVAVPAREVAYADLESIAVAKQGMSPGIKVLIGVGATVGGLLLLGLAVAASAY